MLKQILWRIISNKERLYININTRQSCKFREINLTNIILLSSMHNLSPLLLHNWSPKSNSCTILNTMKRNCQKQFIPELPFCFPKTPLCQWNPQTAVLGTVCEPSAPCVASVSSGPLPRAEKTKPSYQSWQSRETAEGKGTAIPENMEHLQLDSLWKNASSNNVWVTFPSSSHNPCQCHLRLWEHWYKLRGAFAHPVKHLQVLKHCPYTTRAEINPLPWILMFRMQIHHNKLI